MAPLLLAVIGTRPEAIKMAPLVLALRARGDFRVEVLATGQQQALLDEAWAAFGLGVDHRLPPSTATAPLAARAATMLAGIDTLLAATGPQLVVAQGDTTSCLAAALAAFYRRVPFAHLEAGLRSGDLHSPFPEEAQRQLIDRLARWHFAPTAAAAATLARENAAADAVHVVGNTAIDALHWMLPRAGPSPWPESPTHRLLVTLHRRESFGAPLDSIARGLLRIAARPDVRLLLPLHPNPSAQEPLCRALAGHPRITLTPPLPYPAMVAALRDSTLLLTDSGGLQEEAPALGLPALVLRERTERPEGLAAGTARLLGTDGERIAEATLALLADAATLASMRRVHHPYGDGSSGARIAQILALTWNPVT